jgi:MFS family permease
MLDRICLEVVIAGAVAIQLISFTGMLSAFNTVISLLSSPLSGWLSDRTGNRWRLVVVVLALGVVSLSLMAAGEGIIVVLASMLNAIVNSVLITQLTAVVGDYTHHNAAGSKRLGSILGIMNTVGDIGGTAC